MNETLVLWIGGVVVTIVAGLLGALWKVLAQLADQRERAHNREFTTIEGALRGELTKINLILERYDVRFVTREAFDREMARQTAELKLEIAKGISRSTWPAVRAPGHAPPIPREDPPSDPPQPPASRGRLPSRPR